MGHSFIISHLCFILPSAGYSTGHLMEGSRHGGIAKQQTIGTSSLDQGKNQFKTFRSKKIPTYPWNIPRTTLNHLFMFRETFHIGFFSISGVYSRGLLEFSWIRSNDEKRRDIIQYHLTVRSTVPQIQIV